MNITEEDFILLNRLVGWFHWAVFFPVAVLTVYFFYRLKSAQRVHANFRLVLACAAGSFLTYSATRLIIHSILHFTQHIDDRFYVNLTCAIISTFHLITMMSSALCLTMLAVEQHLATIWVENYEERTHRVGVILLLIVVVQSVPTGSFLNWYFILQDYDFHKTKTTCIPIELHWELAWLGFSICTVSCMGCSIWLICLHKYNVAKTKDRLSMKTLSARFQQTENENSNKSIAPSIIGYMILAFVGIMLSEVRRRIVVANGKETPASELMTRIGYMSVDCYAVYHMACFIYFNNAMRSLVRQDITRLFGVKTADYCCNSESIHPESQAVETEAYFNQFKSAWG